MTKACVVNRGYLWVTFLSVALTTSVVVAQEADFAGSWNLDTEKSDPFIPQGPVPEIAMSIEQSAGEVRISQTFRLQGQEGTINYTYVTDEVERELPDFRGGTRTATAQWKKGKLVVRSKRERETPRGTFEFETLETWKLSKDGSQLTVDFSTRFGQRNVTQRSLYHRQ